MTLKTYNVKYINHEGETLAGVSDAFDVRQAMSSFIELTPECKRIIACVQKPEW